MKMTRAMWKELDFEYCREAECWWSTATQLSFGSDVSLKSVVTALINTNKAQSEWMGKHLVRSKIREALGL